MANFHPTRDCMGLGLRAGAVGFVPSETSWEGSGESVRPKESQGVRCTC